MSQFVTSGGQNIGVSASASVLPMNIQDRFPLGWTGWIFLLSKGLFFCLMVIIWGFYMLCQYNSENFINIHSFIVYKYSIQGIEYLYYPDFIILILQERKLRPENLSHLPKVTQPGFKFRLPEVWTTMMSRPFCRRKTQGSNRGHDLPEATELGWGREMDSSWPSCLQA